MKSQNSVGFSNNIFDNRKAILEDQTPVCFKFAYLTHFTSDKHIANEDEKVFKHANLSVRLFLEPLQVRYPHQKCENFNTFSQFSH